jgi:hypothetical protein
MSARVNSQSHVDPALDADGRAAADPGRTEGIVPSDPAASPHHAWHRPQLTHIEIKRTMLGSGAFTDGEIPTADAVLPNKP